MILISTNSLVRSVFRLYLEGPPKAAVMKPHNYGKTTENNKCANDPAAYGNKWNPSMIRKDDLHFLPSLLSSVMSILILGTPFEAGLYMQNPCC